MFCSVRFYMKSNSYMYIILQFYKNRDQILLEDSLQVKTEKSKNVYYE